jgi:transcription initiation factor TFIIIB Brf1 subunit/transcription initiation factor TFIIB
MLAKMSAWCMASHGERSWIGIFDIITNTGSKAGLPRSILLEACGLFKQIADAQKTRGESRRALMAAAVFTACSKQGATRSHEEIASLFNVSVRSLCKNVPSYENGASSVLQTQIGLAERLCVELGATEEQRNVILKTLETLGELEHTPKTVVAGVAARVLGGDRACMNRVSKASGVSVLSIRKMVEKV